MAALTVQEVTDAGLANITFTAAAGGGDTVVGAVRAGGWDSATVALIVRNADAATKNVTVGTNAPITVPATTGMAIIPIVAGFDLAATAVTYSAVTSVTVAAVRLAA